MVGDVVVLVAHRDPGSSAEGAQPPEGVAQPLRAQPVARPRVEQRVVVAALVEEREVPAEPEVEPVDAIGHARETGNPRSGGRSCDGARVQRRFQDQLRAILAALYRVFSRGEVVERAERQGPVGALLDLRHRILYVDLFQDGAQPEPRGIDRAPLGLPFEALDGDGREATLVDLDGRAPRPPRRSWRERSRRESRRRGSGSRALRRPRPPGATSSRPPRAGCDS